MTAEKVLKGLALKVGFNIWGHFLSEKFNILQDKIKIPKNHALNPIRMIQPILVF